MYDVMWVVQRSIVMDAEWLVNQKNHWPLIQLSHSKISQKPGKIQCKPYSIDACFSYVDLFDYQWMYHVRPSHLIPLQHLAVHLVYDHVLALHPSVPAYSLQQISYLSIVMEPSPIPLSLYTSLSLPVTSPRQPQPDATVSCGGGARSCLCVCAGNPRMYLTRNRNSILTQ